MERIDNWMHYTFDDGEEINGAKPHKKAVMNLHFKKGHEWKKMSYYDALLYKIKKKMIAHTHTGT